MVSGAVSSSQAAAGSSRPTAQRTAAQRRLDTQKLAKIAQLKATDRHVRAHEEAHLAVAGPYATGGPSYTFAIGPDGERYAVGGEVRLNTSPVPSDPEATIQKAKTIEAAANAPVDPSSQDRQVAADAARMEAAAEAQISAQQRKTQSAYLSGNAPAPAQLITLLV